jgi:hypothetical protein
MPKPDSQTLASVTALLMAGSHSDHIVADKIPYYMGIAKSICDQAVIVYPNADSTVTAPAEPLHDTKTYVSPVTVLSGEQIAAIAAAVREQLQPPPPPIP